MWPAGINMYILANHDGSPVLVKYGDGICYLPVFESKKAAAEAASNLANTSSPSLIKSDERYTPAEFSWSSYRKWRYEHLEHGHTLFVYPMSPQDYGSKSTDK
jgi:hypothetical protein